MDCLLAHADGTLEDVRIHQREASEVLGGDVTLVGAVAAAHVFAVGRRDAAALPPNPLCTDPSRFDVPVRGPVLFVATDDEGEEMPVDRERLLACLRGAA
jgi:hypothetical protein